MTALKALSISVIGLLLGVGLAYSHAQADQALLRADISLHLPFSPRHPVNPFLLAEVAEVLSSQRIPYPQPFKPVYRMEVISRAGRRLEYWLDFDGRCYDPRQRTLFERRATSLVDFFSSQVFAPSVPWDEVKEKFRVGSVASLQDLETGLTVLIHRHGGTFHADVEPYTVKDTETLRAIYGGRWSWNRRAVILIVDGHRMAASMSLFPHGNYTIKDNGFPGHFCLHFSGSITHGTRRVDPGHQTMILKASGRLFAQVHAADPAEVTRMALIAINEEDSFLLRYLTTSLPTSPETLWGDLRYLEAQKIHLVSEDDTKASVQVVLRIYRTSGGVERLERTLSLIRTGGRWLLNGDDLPLRVPPFSSPVRLYYPR